MRLLSTNNGPASLVTTEGEAYPVQPQDITQVGSAYAIPVEFFGATDAADFAATATSALAFGAANDVAILFAHQYTATAPIAVASGAHFIGTPGTVITADFASTGQPTNALFFANITQSNPQNLGTVNATPAFGATVVQVALPHDPTGQAFLSVGPGLGQQIAAIVAVAVVGGGVYNVTLSEPLVQPIQNGDQAFTMSAIPERILMEGNGMLLKSTGAGPDRMLEFVGAYRCRVTGFRYVGSAGNVVSSAAFSFDIGGRENLFDSLDVDLTGSGALVEGIMLEAQLRSLARRCNVKNAGARGFIALDCVASGFEDCTVLEGNNGIFFVADGGARGCFSCWAANCQTYNCNSGAGSIGIAVGQADGIELENCTAQNCSIGMQTGNGGATSVRIYARKLDTSYCSQGGVAANSDLTVDGYTCEGVTAAINIFAVLTANRVVVRSGRIDTSGQVNAFVVAAAGRLYLQDCVVAMTNGAGSANAFIAEPGTLIMDRCSASGAHAVGIFLAAAGAYGRIGENVDVSGCSTPTSTVGGTAFNRGTFNSANGATAISFPDLTAEDSIIVTPTAAVASGFVSANTPGTGFSWTDTGVHSYSYAIL